jgi:hypothetical protein
MRTLVLYYSETGHTRTVAEDVAANLAAELSPITCKPYRQWTKPIAMAWDIFTRHLPDIELTIPPGPPHDLTIIGGPVWAGRAAPPIMRLLLDHGAALGKVGLFVTCGGTSPNYPPERAMAEMAAMLPGKIIASRVFREAEIATGRYHTSVADFAITLAKATTPAPASVHAA